MPMAQDGPVRSCVCAIHGQTSCNGQCPRLLLLWFVSLREHPAFFSDSGQLPHLVLVSGAQRRGQSHISQSSAPGVPCARLAPCAATTVQLTVFPALDILGLVCDGPSVPLSPSTFSFAS